MSEGSYRYAGCDHAEDRDSSDVDLDIPAPTPMATPFDQQCIHGGQAPHAPTRGVCPDEVCDWLGVPSA